MPDPTETRDLVAELRLEAEELCGLIQHLTPGSLQRRRYEVRREYVLAIISEIERLSCELQEAKEALKHQSRTEVSRERETG